jgi:hypothetical protein
MTIEFVGEKIFREEVEASRQVWVARSSHQNIYVMELERAGLSLPVWSSRERVTEYLKNARLIGPKYEPHGVPLDVFKNAWLSDKLMAIIELLINPNGKTAKMLALTTAEFQNIPASE